MLVDLCLPVKNEALILPDNLERLLDYCRRADFHFAWRIVGVINGSTDDSRLIWQDFQKRYPDQVAYFEVKEAGRGRALREYWSVSQADILAYMDADLAVSLDNIIDLINPLLARDADVTAGSRLAAGARVQRSRYRDLISYAYVYLSRFLLGHHFLDLQCGFKAVRSEVFRAVKPRLADDYWFFDTELMVLAQRLGYRVREVPVDWRENRYLRRATKVRLVQDSLVFLKNLWRFRQRLRRFR
ncbi:MAG: glycosyltransferase [Patescibacteria group bacterium]